jgi:hypothetical protein
VGIHVIVLKGPPPAHLGVGLQLRVFGRHGLPVRADQFVRASEALRSLGYAIQNGPCHPFHIRYVRKGAYQPTVLKLHFDVADRKYPYLPDVDAIWAHSVDLPIEGHSFRVPELLDRLLSTIIQLLFHY